MKKYILILGLFIAASYGVSGQTTTAFNTVPVLNGKVVFEHFVVSEQGNTADQNYAKLQKWAKDKFTGSPLLSGIRYDDKAQSVTVSSKADLKMPAGSSPEMTMSYRFDLSATNAGCMLIMRDISFQSTNKDADSFFPKVYAAEQMITDQAVKAGGPESGLRNDTRKAAIQFINDLYNEVSTQFY